MVNLNVRHRPSLEESVNDRFVQVVSSLRRIEPPWGIDPAVDVKLPLMGTRLATHVKLRNKLGKGITGELVFRHRAPSNLQNNSAYDDFLQVEFESEKVQWDVLTRYAFPRFVEATGAYLARLSYFELMSAEWRLLSALERSSGMNLDGRDGILRFGPITFMDTELCRLTCGGMSPGEVATRLSGVVESSYESFGGVVIVATKQFPEIHEFTEIDKTVRAALGLRQVEIGQSTSLS